MASQGEAWSDLRPDEHRSAATTLLLALEQAAFLLADNLRHQKVVSHSFPNIREYLIIDFNLTIEAYYQTTRICL